MYSNFSGSKREQVREAEFLDTKKDSPGQINILFSYGFRKNICRYIQMIELHILAEKIIFLKCTKDVSFVSEKNAPWDALNNS